MFAFRIYIGVLLTLLLAAALAAQTYPLIIRGKVTMQNGSAPPQPVGIQRTCSDVQGSAPGPLTDKKGEYLWRMDVDPTRTRVCYLDARLQGYVSTRIDISAFNGFISTTKDLPPLMLRPAIPDPRTINASETDVPAKSKNAWKAAMKAVDADNLEEAQKQLQAVTEGSPRFARGWHTLGIVEQAQQKLPQARDAFQHAIDADPKSFGSYVMIARIGIKSKDWQSAANASDALIKADPKLTYPEIYLHQAAARLKLKDLAGAESAAANAQNNQIARAEFILGRIAEAKGDLAGAREHITKYIALDPTASDIGQIQLFLEALGKPEAANFDPDLEAP
jgi:hypothetical protein